MRKNSFGALVLLALGLFLSSGCAKDSVKSDAGVAPDKTVASANGQDQAALDRAAAERAAAERAAAERAAAERAAAEKAAADKAAADKSAEAVKKALQTIYFDFDSFTLRQGDRDILYKNAEYLLKKYKGKVKLEGHCDERGSDEYNLALGENRAKTAMNYLLTLGVPAEQLSVVSYGEEKPADPGHTEEAWAKNRRVEFTIAK